MTKEKIKAFFRNKWTIIGISAVLIAAIVTTTVLLTLPKEYMTIRALDTGNEISRRPEDWRKSRLFLHENGTFSFTIIYTAGGNQQDLPIFMGIGTFKKNKNSYTFTFVDMYRRDTIGGVTKFARDEEHMNWRTTYRITKQGYIEIQCPGHRSYYFK